MKQPIKLLLTITLLALLLGCTDADTAQLASYGKKHKITLYGNNGIIIKSWTSTGAITSNSGDGCLFKDETTKLMIEIRGTMIIETLE